MYLRTHIIFLFGSSSFLSLSSVHKFEGQYSASIAIFVVQIGQDLMLIKNLHVMNSCLPQKKCLTHIDTDQSLFNLI
jgi:hypothetical protein